VFVRLPLASYCGSGLGDLFGFFSSSNASAATVSNFLLHESICNLNSSVFCCKINAESSSVLFLGPHRDFFRLFKPLTGMDPEEDSFGSEAPEPPLTKPQRSFRRRLLSAAEESSSTMFFLLSENVSAAPLGVLLPYLPARRPSAKRSAHNLRTISRMSAPVPGDLGEFLQFWRNVLDQKQSKNTRSLIRLCSSEFFFDSEMNLGNDRETAGVLESAGSGTGLVVDTIDESEATETEEKSEVEEPKFRSHAPGLLFGWGSNKDAELGVEVGEKNRHYHFPTMIEVFEGTGVVQVSCGDKFSLVLDEFGNVYSFGTGRNSQTGQETRIRAPPQRVRGALAKRRVRYVVAGHSSSAAVSEDGEVFEWGLLHFNPDKEQNAASIEVHGIRRPENEHSAQLRRLLQESTRLYLQANVDENDDEDDDMNATIAEAKQQQAEDEAAQTVDGDSGVVNLRTRRKVFPLPTLVESLKGIKVAKVSLGAAHVAALTEDGRVFTKGYNDRGQLGLGDRFSRASYHEVVGKIRQHKAIDLSCGNAHLLILTEYGIMWATGTNAFGQLGLGQGSTGQLRPVELNFFIERGLHINQIAAGEHHSIALTSKGTVFTWGHAEYGQHGTGSKRSGDLAMNHLTRYYHQPRELHPFSMRDDGVVIIRVKEIAAAMHFGLCLDTNGTLWSWGWNGNSVLGHGAGAGFTVPRVVEQFAGAGLEFLSPGVSHVMVIAKTHSTQFALTYGQLLPPSPVSEERKEQPLEAIMKEGMFDLTISSKLSATQQKLSEEQKSQFCKVPCHQFIVFSRCSKLNGFLVVGEDGQKDVELPVVLQPRVLFAFVEYLYCDHIRSCPPHQMLALQTLAGSLGLKHLVGLCKLGRYHSTMKRELEFAMPSSGLHGTALTFDHFAEIPDKCIQPEIPPSNFAQDMLAAVKNTVDHDVFLCAADTDLEDQIEDGEGKANHARSAHMPVLCRYPFFEKLLTGSFKEGQVAKDKSEGVTLHNLTPRGLSTLLHWVYSGDRSVCEPSSVMSVLASAMCFGVVDLASVAEQYIIENMDLDSVQFVEEFAQDINSKRLEYYAKRLRESV